MMDLQFLTHSMAQMKHDYNRPTPRLVFNGFIFWQFMVIQPEEKFSMPWQE